jgi:hypothetical protein
MRRVVLGAVTLALATMAGGVEPCGVSAQAVVAPVYEAQPGEQVVERTNWALVAPGIPILGAGYVLNVITGLLGGVCVNWGWGSCPSDEPWGAFRIWSLVPIVGPWAQLAALPANLGDNPGWIAWQVAMGALQITGLALLVIGLATPVRVVRPAQPYVALEPVVGPDMAGLSLRGAF